MTMASATRTAPTNSATAASLRKRRTSGAPLPRRRRRRRRAAPGAPARLGHGRLQRLFEMPADDGSAAPAIVPQDVRPHLRRDIAHEVEPAFAHIADERGARRPPACATRAGCTAPSGRPPPARPGHPSRRAPGRRIRQGGSSSTDPHGRLRGRSAGVRWASLSNEPQRRSSQSTWRTGCPGNAAAQASSKAARSPRPRASMTYASSTFVFATVDTE